MSVAKKGKVLGQKKMLQPLLGTPEGIHSSCIIIFSQVLLRRSTLVYKQFIARGYLDLWWYFLLLSSYKWFLGFSFQKRRKSYYIPLTFSILCNSGHGWYQLHSRGEGVSLEGRESGHFGRYRRKFCLVTLSRIVLRLYNIPSEALFLIIFY